MGFLPQFLTVSDIFKPDTPQQIAAQNNVANVDQLSKRQCSALIEQWKVA